MTNDSDEKQPNRPRQADKPGESPAASSDAAAEKPQAAGEAKPPAPAPPAPAKPATPAAPPVAPVAPPAAAATPPKPAAPATPGAPAAAKPAAPAAAKPAGPPPPPKEAPPKPVPLENDLVKRYKARFGGAILEAWLDRKQSILVTSPDRLLEIAQYTRDEEKFDYLVDLTAVDWPKREKRFDLVLILYSFPKNERLRIKAPLAEDEPVPSVEGVWPTANWLEREIYDMFGIVFEGHSNLKRLLLPEEWQGYPLRKDYDILQQDQDWVRENLGIESGQ
jgi:NADH-quinone oxidoreductase subunit C